MAPIGYGVLATIAGVIVVGLLVGLVGGVINGRLRGDLALGAILAGLMYFLLVIVLEPRSYGKFALLGMLPLLLTFVIGSATTRLLETRFRPAHASLVALSSAMLAGFLYLMLIRLEWLPLADPGTVWIAGAVLACLIVLSIRKRLRSAR